MKSRIDVVGQNGNDGLHYELDDGQLTDEQYARIKEYEYELDKSTGEVIKKYTRLDKLNPKYSDEFWNWYNFFLQSPRMCSLQYDDEKMWEAWRVGYKLGRDNAYKRKDCPPEIFTIPKEKHIHTMNKTADEMVNKYPNPILDLEKQLYENHMLQSKPDGVIKK